MDNSKLIEDRLAECSCCGWKGSKKNLVNRMGAIIINGVEYETWEFSCPVCKSFAIEGLFND